MTLTATERLQIQQVLHAYCHIVDYGAPEAMREVFAQDLEFTAPAAQQSFRGLDSFIAFLGTRLATRKGVRHLLTNIVIEERASGVRTCSYVQLFNMGVSPPQLLLLSRYHDEWVCVDGVWRIKRRRMED